MVGDPGLLRLRHAVRLVGRLPLARVRPRHGVPLALGERRRLLPRIVHAAARADAVALVARPPPLRHDHRRTRPRGAVHPAVPRGAQLLPNLLNLVNGPKMLLADGPSRRRVDRRRGARLRPRRRAAPSRRGRRGRSSPCSRCRRVVRRRRGPSSRCCSSGCRRSTGRGCCGSSPRPSTPACARTSSTTA